MFLEKNRSENRCFWRESLVEDNEVLVYKDEPSYMIL